jgi:hypothetical protein
MSVNKKDSNLVRIGDYIEVYDIKNVNSKDLHFCGINKDKTFMPTVADTNELDSSKYKIVEKDDENETENGTEDIDYKASYELLKIAYEELQSKNKKLKSKLKKNLIIEK